MFRYVFTLWGGWVNILMVGGTRRVQVGMHTMHSGNMNSQAEKMAELTNLDPAWGLILSVYGDHSEGIHLITNIDFMFHSEDKFVFVIVFVKIFVYL